MKAPDKLKPKNRENPLFQNKLLDKVVDTLTSTVRKFKKKKPKSNLTHLEVEGMKWCQKMVREKTIYITRVDKGGSIMTMNSPVVVGDIKMTLEDTAKYTKLEKDPRDRIRSEIHQMIDTYVEA